MAEYIDREKIAAEARRLSTHLLNDWDTLGVLALINRQPAADVAEVRHGHWIRREGFDYENNVILGACSKCDCGVKDFTNYCPNCGAKMDESENDEE